MNPILAAATNPAVGVAMGVLANTSITIAQEVQLTAFTFTQAQVGA